MKFETVEKPKQVMTHAERNKKWKKKNPEKVQAQKKLEDERDYLRRPFIAWDGEGVTDPSDNEHYYNMLANSMGDCISTPHNSFSKYSGLSTVEILEFLCDCKSNYPDAIHIIYGGGYDFNMFLKDLTRDELWELYKKDKIIWRGFSLTWRRGRTFEVRDLTVRDSKAIIIYDTIPFFQTSFINACDSYLGDRFQARDIIVEQKKNRGTFTNDDFKTVRHYNDLELVNLVLLLEELRIRLNKVGIRLKRWDGPGAIATVLLSRYKVPDAMAECPEEVARAARFAYAGGRFEPIKLGVNDEPAYEYDLNSAYPYALQFLPNLNNGRWIYRDKNIPRPKRRESFTLYHVQFWVHPSQQTENTNNKHAQPRPFFQRLKDGNIYYGEKVEGWFWASEVYEGFEYIKRHAGKIALVESWEFVENDPNDKPFSFVPKLYHERQLLKAAGDGAHVGIKLGLNSMYGKLAQQVGWRKDYYGNVHKPPFHQLEWAGFTTALCRSLVLHAAIENLDSVIAFETDALFTSKKLDHLEIGPGLGNWEVTEFKNLSYIQSGFYFGDVVQNDGSTKTIIKTRGVNKPSEEDALQFRHDIEESFLTYGSYTADATRFITAGQALHQKFELWHTWVTTPREISGHNAATKRFHAHEMCKACNYTRPAEGTLFFNSDTNERLARGWHDTTIGFKSLLLEWEDRMNVEYPIEWLETSTPKDMQDEITNARADDYEQIALWDENGV